MQINLRKMLYKIVSLLLIILFAAGSMAYADPAEPIAKAAILVEADTGEVLYRYNDNTKLPIASVTKIMTLCLIFDAIDAEKLSYDDVVTVSKNASNMGGSQVFLENGGKYKAQDLIKSIIIASANDACVAMAEHLEGSQQNFVSKMNSKAKELEMNGTKFVNCTGMPADGHFSTAYDVAIMSRELLKHDDFYKYSSIWMDKIEHSKGRITELTNTNKLVRFFDGCDGVKTGYTDEAGHCISATVSKNGMRLISVIIGGQTSQQRFDDARRLINYGFDTYTLVDLLDNVEIPKSISVEGGMDKEIEIIPGSGAKAILKRDDEKKIKFRVEIPKSVKAPIHKGETVGELIFEQDGKVIAKINMISAQEGNKATLGEYFNKLIERW